MNEDDTNIMDVFNAVTDFARKFLELGESVKKVNDILDGYSPKAAPTVKEPRKAREFVIYRRKSQLGYSVDHMVGTLPFDAYDLITVREVIENE